MNTPTLINLPPPPSDPVTPSEMGPGTPNSGTTSLSALSTTAIKDGHKGHAPPHAHHHHNSSKSSNSSTNTLDAERADRISRLAGLERVTSAHQSASGTSNFGSGFGVVPMQHPPPGYFDHAGNYLGKDRSTVGSASATESAGGRTTWASGSDVYDPDKMSDNQDDGISSTGMSDEGNASLVGFGEAASGIDGPTSGRLSLGASRNSPTALKPGAVPRAGGDQMQGVIGDLRGLQRRNANMTGQETSDRIVRERLSHGENLIHSSMEE